MHKLSFVVCSAAALGGACLGFAAEPVVPVGRVEIASVEHPVLADFPFEPYLSPLLFRIVREGTKLPVPGFTEKDLVIAGEGLREAYAYLAVRDLPNGRKHVFVSGLDLAPRTVEGRALRRAILKYLGGCK